MERIGSDRVIAAGTRLIVLSRAAMAGWDVRSFRRPMILFRDTRYFVASRERAEGGYRYTLERWPDDREDIDAGVIEYDEAYVAERDAASAARVAARGVRAFLLPLYPFIGLLPGALKKRLADGYGISESVSTSMSLWLELMVAAASIALFSIQSITGVYGSAFGVRGPISWLSNLTVAAVGALLLIVPDLVMRYARILAESTYPYGFWEWLFRWERSRTDGWVSAQPEPVTAEPDTAELDTAEPLSDRSPSAQKRSS